MLNSAQAAATVVNTFGEYLEEYRFRPYPIAELVRKAVTFYAGEAARRGISIRNGLSATRNGRGRPEISRIHMQFAINNLLHNSIKYSFTTVISSPRERTVVISGGERKGMFEFHFENYGVGITPEEIEQGKLFEEGYKGQLTRGEYRSGAGKGLAFVKRVMDAHGGTISITSKLMAETDAPFGAPHLNRFTIRLPYRHNGGRNVKHDSMD